MKKMWAMIVAAGVSACLVTGADGDIRVLLLGQEFDPGSFADVRAKIDSTGRVDARYDTFSISAGAVPTLEQLKNYDVVFVWSASIDVNGAALGNVMADYVDAGGGVIETTFVQYERPDIGMAGRWKTGGYAAMTATGQIQGAVQGIGSRLVPSHPILDGVTTFSGGPSSFRCTTTVTPGSYLIASWNDGAQTPLVATRHANAGKVASLNFYPVSGSVRSDQWDPATQGGLLMANAINWAADNKHNVLVLGAVPVAGWLDEAKARIEEGGRVAGRVEVFNVGAGTPTAAQLRDFDSVVVFSDIGTANPVLLGNRLADYVDSGGGVVVSTFAQWFGIEGRFVSGGYQPFIGSSQTSGSVQTLGARLIPNHPLLDKVGSFSGGTNSFRITGTLAPGAIRIADWSDGTPLLTAMPGKKGRVATLNFYPPSNLSRADFWDRTTDGAALLGNAINWTARNDNDVLVLGDNFSGGTLADINAKISPFVDGRFETYDYTGPTPSLARLKRFDSILVFSNINPSDRSLLGDRLADFVDGGGGVVDMYGSNLADFGPTGRWVSGRFSALEQGSIQFSGTLTLGAKLLPKHPVLDLVADVNIGTLGAHNNGALRAGALRIADLSNGAVLAAENSRSRGRVVTLNYFPASSDIGVGTWVPSTDAGRMIGNALNHVARSDADVLVVATEDVNSGFYNDAVKGLARSSRLRGPIARFDNQLGNPSLDLLRAYDSVLLWANFGQPDPNGLGNVVADYADLGGGVVTALGIHAGSPFAIGGRWATSYSAAQIGAGLLNGANATLASRQQRGHPVLSGVDNVRLTAGAFEDIQTLTIRGERIATSSTGRPMVAEAKVPAARQSIAVNFWAPFNAVGWEPSTDGGLLITNALTYVAKERPCVADFNNDGFVDFFDYSDFVQCFEGSACPRGRDADVNGDGFIDFFDYGDYVDLFERGC
jgi:hypothetical protein